MQSLSILYYSLALLVHLNGEILDTRLVESEIRGNNDSTTARPNFLIPSSSEDYEENGESGENVGPTKDNSTDYGKFLLPPNYNKLAIPVGSNGRSVYVYVSLFIRTILDIDEQNGELLLDCDFGLRWVDWNIYDYLSTTTNWTDPETGQKVGNRTLDSKALQKIWNPDVFIDQMSSVEKTSILSKSIQLHFLSNTNGSDSGDIVYSARTKLKLRCSMDFAKFPSDTQTCVYYLRSYSYPEEKLVLYWKKSSVYLEDPSDANFDVQLYDVEPVEKYDSLHIEELFDYYRRGNYSVLQFTIKARRHLSYHAVQTYLPSVLLIFITWLCFLLPASMVEARIGISMTTLLTLTAMFASVRQSSPRVSYTMALDIYMVFNIFFVFVVLLLFTFTYWMKLRLKNQQQKVNDAEDDDAISEADLPTIETYQKVVNVTQRYGFWSFSMTFLIFLFIYWVWLLSSSKYFDWEPNPKYNTIFEDNDEPFPWTKGKYLLHKHHREPNSNRTLGYQSPNINWTEDHV